MKTGGPGPDFGGCGTLAEAILVGLRHEPEWNVVEVIVQDEYTHDVIMQGVPGGPAIVLDCT